ncbi:MAG: hypothetical protein KME56_08105 [Candidatus Thiodiazotropha sp. (ex Ctena orbiculata)]|nr:hypothetical protein [Candidatus Thiodiazotropha taylori]MBT2996579.1 hypothetical protein [Candidatus Thiodiazotropha taylori]MBT3000619.1 hypothetical protein [Candidatus Thiodiazotropha taylori]MBV2106948.1 hypothetical protein [Candidatus Thiodiazotropha taylori]MBV2111114.1 hypothetical protein [Candidatus Thiodiazotropha taylori]
MRKIIGPLLTGLLIVGVGTGIYLSAGKQLSQLEKATIRGLIGSEKLDFFNDPRVIEALSDHGLEIEVKKSGSREIATRHDLKNWDFAFPAGIPAAEKITRGYAAKKSFQVAFTPMVIASWLPIAEILENNGIVTKRDGIYYFIDMKRMLHVIEQGKRWTDLEHNSNYQARKSILINSTDIRRSNSAAMYLALASYIFNDEQVLENNEQANQLTDRLSNLYVRQGYTEHSSAVPFNDYLVMGIGKAPMVMAYEAQYLYSAAENKLRPDMRLLYPEPTIYTKHVLVALTDAGVKLGEVLTTDPKLQKLMIEHGWRNEDISGFDEFISKHNLQVPTSLVNVIEPPSYEVIESTIQKIEQQHYDGAH